MMGAPDIEGLVAGTTFTSVARLRNVSGTTIVVTPVVTYKQSGSPHSMTLPTRTLQPDQLDVMDLNAAVTAAGAVGPFVGMGVKFTYTGQTQALVAQITSVDGIGNLAFEVPLKDPGVSMNRYGGSYPFKLDGDYRSVVHLRNTADSEADVTVQLDYDGGKFVSELLTLAPQQEVSVDLKKIRDLQIQDGKDEVIPLSVTAGRLTWLEHSEQAVIGRMEIYSPSAGLTSSFSCPYACCPPDTFSVTINPGSLELGVGQSGFVSLFELRFGGCGDPTIYGPFNVTRRTTWTSSNENVATITPFDHKKCRVQSVGVGPVNLSAEVLGVDYADYDDCQLTRLLENDEAPTVVVPTLSGPATVIRTQNATFAVNLGVSDSEAQVSNWTFTDGTNVVSRLTDPNGASWSGTMVTSGVVGVQVTVGSATYQLTRPVVVNSRPGWMFTPVEPVKQLNGFSAVLTIPDTPALLPGGESSTELGKSQLRLQSSWLDGRVDEGPNLGYRYVESAQDGSLANGPTFYYWIVATDYDNPNSTFYKKQCGNYNPTAGTGFDSIGVQYEAIAHHEAVGDDSHYSIYLYLQSQPDLNIKAQYEGVVANQSVSRETYIIQVNSLITSAYEALYTAWDFHPCIDDPKVRLPNCGRYIRINYAPYVTCPTP